MRRERGFTLVELLVALTLIGIMAAALFGALRFSTRAWDASAARLQDSGDTAAIRRFLRERLEQAVPLLLPDRTGRREAEAAFAGEPHRLRFAAPMPAEVSPGGLYLFTLAPGEEGTLELDWALLRPEGPMEIADGRRRPRPLLAGEGAQVRFRYYGLRGDEERERWHEAWRSLTLPRLIELRFGEDGSIPPLIVAPIAD